jgi:hypothetical protein
MGVGEILETGDLVPRDGRSAQRLRDPGGLVPGRPVHVAGA